MIFRLLDINSLKNLVSRDLAVIVFQESKQINLQGESIVLLSSTTLPYSVI